MQDSIQPQARRLQGNTMCHQPMLLPKHDCRRYVPNVAYTPGVVIGCLTPDGEVDMEANRRLIEVARPMSVSFHRAFDRSADPFKALEDIIKLGCERILTSGQQPKAIDGVNLLAELQKKAAGRIILLAGSGVTEDNIRAIYEATGITEYHFSARISKPSLMRHYNHEVYMGAKGADETNIMVTSAERVIRLILFLLLSDIICQRLQPNNVS